MRPSARLLAMLALLGALPVGGAAQQGSVLLGRVYDADTDAPVQNAIVTLEGFGSTLTDAEGQFRFRGVEDGTHTLRVDAFSYAPYDQTVELEGDTALDLPLGSSPIPLDSLLVEAGTVDYQGRVRDPERDFLLVDAQVLVRGRDPIWTDAHGRFNVEDLPEGLPVGLSIRSFGYLPIDTAFVPDDERRYDFDLEADPFAEALMAMQTRRLDDRAGGRLMTGWLLMDRDQIIRYTGSHTASTMLTFELPRRILGRIACTFIDERQIDQTPGAIGREIREAVLTHTLPEEIERVELLTFDNLLGRPIMLQIYTRAFVMAMATQDVRLRTPNMIPLGEGYTCF